MVERPRKVVIIGAGIAGLCAGVYAQRSGYDALVLEQHHGAGGLAASWRRGDYTFETCLHWLVGTNPAGQFHALWNEVFDIDKLRFIHPEIFVRLETGHGEALNVYTNIDRLEAEFLKRAPQDAVEIRRYASAVRRMTGFAIPDPGASWPGRALAALRLVPLLPLWRHWTSITCAQEGEKFRHPLIRHFFAGGGNAELAAIVLVMTLAWMSAHDGGYAIGGSQAIIRPIVERLNALGGQVRFGAGVKRIRVEQGKATGVELENGEIITADWVVSAADGHSTIYQLLDGQFTGPAIDDAYKTRETFPSYLQVSLGVARDLSGQAGYVTRLLDDPIQLDPGTRLPELSFRFFHFDPTFAPPGKTAVTAFLPTRNAAYWTGLERKDHARYAAEKLRVAAAVIDVLDRCIPGVRKDVEIVDVSTPATVIRLTRNWKGSMEGWLPTPASGFKPLAQRLPGLDRFLMAGQWTAPGGGLPLGLMTARSAIKTMCRQDRVRFLGLG